MLLLRIRQKMLPLLLVLSTLSCFPLPATGPSTLAPLQTGASIVLDSPDARAFKQVSPFILENFGVMKVEKLDQHTKDDKEDDLPLWNIKLRLKRTAARTEQLALELAQTPTAEQYAIAAKLTEQEAKKTSSDDTEEPEAPANIVSIDLLRELQFLNGNNRSILSAISRASTKGGEIATVALVAKCSDQIPVIKARRDFIKYLIDNPMTLETLRDKLEIIKTAEPLLFSNYRPFKQARLKAIVKGGLIKEFAKKVFATHEAEQFATQTELVYKPLASFTISSLLACHSLIDLFRALFSKGEDISDTGGYAKLVCEKILPALKVPWFKKLIYWRATNQGWKHFLREELSTHKSFKRFVDTVKTNHEENQKIKWLKKPFLHVLERGLKQHYFSEGLPDSKKIEFLRKSLDKHLEEKCRDKALNGGYLSFEQFQETTKKKRGNPRLAGKIIIKADAHTRISWRTQVLESHIDQSFSVKERNKIYNVLAFLGLAGAAALIIPQIEMSMKALTENYLDLKNLFDSVQAPYKIYKAAKEMHTLLAGIEETSALYPTCVASASKPWLNFLKIAESNTFKTSFTMSTMAFKDHGKVVQAYQFLNQSHAEIGELIRFYGELDAYVSMATLVKEYTDTMNNQGTPVRYSTVEFIENSQYPRFEADHYWNPIFANASVVPNEINLGDNGLSRNAIVTGANAGGKSGNLKAILTNIILAQTFGIAPSEHLKMTPFSNILATLKSNDDAANNKSRFQVEALEMAKVMQRIITTPPDKFTAVFSDELFAGTEVEPAIALSRRICLSIAGMDNVMYLLATHYKELTKLEVLTRGVFKNFKVEVIKLPDGSLFRPYKLLEGIGGTNIAFDVFLEQLKEIGMKNDYLYNMVMQAKEDQQNFELINPVKTLGKEGFFSNRKYPVSVI